MSDGSSLPFQEQPWTVPRRDGRIVNAMSVDVEDYFQVQALEAQFPREIWAQQSLRVERNTNRILDIFAEKGVKATFFTLGWVAQRCPAMMRRIADDGHEIASHGWDHARVFTFDRGAFAADLARARATLEDITGQAVTGYRAPSFSIDARNPWAHEVLAEAGYRYSSSVAPIVHDHYGWRDAPRFAFRPVAGAELIEIPVTTVEWGGRRLAAGGGGFFRLFPYALSRWALQRVNRHDNRPALTYFHPWEIDPGQPRIAQAPWRSRLRHYSRLGAMSGKLRRLLGDFSWGRMDALAEREAARLR